MANGEKIIVVDDEPAVRQLLVDILSEEGYSIASSDTPDDALHKIRTGRFDLLFTDLVMPGMDGFELIRQARRILPDIIPIVMTGYGTLDTARAAVKDGVFDYVLKPFNVSEVRTAVAGALERKRALDDMARLRELSDLFKISETINTLRDEKKLLEFVLKAALTKLMAMRGSIMLRDPESDTLRIAASYGLPEGVDKNTKVLLGEGISGWVAKEGKPLLVANVDEDRQFKDASHHLPDKSFVSVPLEMREDNGISVPVRSSKRVLGVINVNKKLNGQQFTPGDLKTLSILANQAAVSLENTKLFSSLQEAYLMTIQSLVLVLEAKDAYTHGHSHRVTSICMRVGARLGLNDDELEALRIAATLHDIGKIAIPESVLNKAAPLSEEEWEVVRRHPVVGCDILAPVTFLTKTMPIIRYHHERQDGKGYPDGVSAGALSKSVRTIIVADAYDAMASDRAYRNALTDDEIEAELTANNGSQFDPEVVTVFLELHRNGEFQALRAQQEKDTTARAETG
jgi:response regulator RpfG family c-di-GMP phosphodiesterase